MLYLPDRQSIRWSGQSLIQARYAQVHRPGGGYFSRDTSPSGGVLERIAEQFNNGPLARHFHSLTFQRMEKLKANLFSASLCKINASQVLAP